MVVPNGMHISRSASPIEKRPTCVCFGIPDDNGDEEIHSPVKRQGKACDKLPSAPFFFYRPIPEICQRKRETKTLRHNEVA
jgi:hypothetical protein